MIGGLALNLNVILAQLREERRRMDEAILSLERLAEGRGPRRGRPPAWIALVKGKERRRQAGSRLSLGRRVER